MTADAKNFTSCRYGSRHEGIQPRGDHESHNDSVYFNFIGPGGVFGGVVRVGLRPNDGYSEASLMLPLGAWVLFHYGRTPLETPGWRWGLPVAVRPPADRRGRADPSLASELRGGGRAADCRSRRLRGRTGGGMARERTAASWIWTSGGWRTFRCTSSRRRAT